MTRPDFAADDADLLRRAMAAYFRSGHRRGLTDNQLDMPANTSYVTELTDAKDDTRRYVVLQNVNGTLAVYRVRPSDGVLREMRRWPQAVAQP